MQTPSRLIRVGAAAVAALALTGCATMGVGFYLERGADFGRYQTYNWLPADSFTTGDPRLDNNPFFRDRIHEAVERQLGARGFEKMPSGSPDLLIHYHANVTQRIDVTRIDNPDWSRDAADERAYVYDAGTLVLDFIDARTNKLVWRAWAEDTVAGAIDNQAWMERKIDEAVMRMLARLPRAL